MRTSTYLLVGILVASSCAATPAASEAGEASEIFNRRVLPILKSRDQSSCTECHVAGVELKNYIRSNEAATFAALRESGLIDVDEPAKSKLLTFIRRHSDKTDPLIAKVRHAELAAFNAWITAAVRDPKLLSAKTDGKGIGVELPPEVIRHMRTDHVLRSFVENVWSEIGRCINCHSPERNQRLVKKHGEQVSWIRPNDPAGTLEQCVEQGIIDTDDPGESLILLKPLVEVEHGGGPKFVLGSRTDKNFRRFLTDYAAIVNAKYKRSEDLPAPTEEVAILTGQHLRIVDLPKDLGGKLLRVNIYRRHSDGWSAKPWGSGDGAINGEREMWQTLVFVVAPRNSARARNLQGRDQKKVRLPDGRYLIKIYIDREGKAKKNPDFEFTDNDLYGEVEIHGAWKPGYQPPKIVHAPKP